MIFKTTFAKIGGALLGAALLTSPLMAQTTLSSPDGKVNLSGELMGFDGTSYRIKTDFGDLVVRKEFVICSGDGCPEEERQAASDAESVLLLANDGSARIPGKLISVTSTEFVIESAHGVLTVRREFVTCEGAGCPDERQQLDRITVAVPDATVADLMTTIVGDYVTSKDFNLTEQLTPGSDLPTLLIGDENGLEVSRLAMAQMDNRTAMRALFNGQVAFALTRQRLTPQQVIQALGFSVQSISDVVHEEIIGLDAIDFVVSDNSSVDVMDIEAVNAILSGQITNWSQLGGADSPVELHSLSQSVSLFEQLKAYGMSNAALTGGATLHDSAEAMNAAIRSRANALGVAFRSQIRNVKSLNLSSACNVFVDSSEFAIQTEEYPLGVRLYRYSLKLGEDSELGRNLGQFINTDFGQRAIESRGMITQELQIVPMQNQGARLLSAVLATADDRVSQSVMRDYLSETSNARRISTSLRFLSGQAVLDSKAVEDISRISEIVRANEYEGYEVLVFGFSDSFGKIGANLALSKRRAEAVRQILLNENSGYLDVGNVSSYGIGPVAPVGCNTSNEGRQRNRRVEIWLRPKA